MFELENYTTAAEILPRLLGLIYLFAIGAFFFQIKGLLGKNGILPISHYLDKLHLYYGARRFYLVPSLFWISSTNQMLMGVVYAGIVCSLLLMAGFYPPFMLGLLYLIHLSIVSTGQDFLGFGWEGFMLEVTANTFLISLTPIPNLIAWISINFLLFRFHIQAGAVKLQSKDPTWKNMTALNYHYQTQPIPNTMAWYIHKAPSWFHKLSVLFMFVVEIIIPFGIFLTQEIRILVFVAFFTLQLMIWLTGNFSYLNYLTATLSIILLNNDSFAWMSILPSSHQFTTPLLNGIVTGLAIPLLVMQIIRLWHHFFPHARLKKILDWIAPFHLANRYGIFAVMTTKRYEIVIEGSQDRQEWKEYLFRYKPSEIIRRPRRISPYQPRLDWQAWFLPFSDFYTERWFKNFLIHLLKGTPEVLGLLRHNPFSDHPPRYIRVKLYDYEFSSFAEKKEHGWWWRRKFIEEYTPILTLRHNQQGEPSLTLLLSPD